MAQRPPEFFRMLAWLAVPLGLGSAGCADTGTVPTTIVHPTLIQVSPVEFLQGVPCLDADGAMRSYVATVYDLGPADKDGDGFPDTDPPEAFDPITQERVDRGFALPSSGPVACTEPVGFGQVKPGNRYRAEVFGYDRPGLEALAAGVGIMVDSTTKERVEPRWTASCGFEPEHSPTICHAQFARTIRGCKPLVDAMPSDVTAVEVRIDGVLGALVCGQDAGQVSHYEVEVRQGERVSAACGESIVLDTVSAGDTLLLPVFAFEAGTEEPSWGTTCTASPASGATVKASCTTLTDRGGVDVSPLGVLEAYGLDCSALGELTLHNPSNPKDSRTVTASGCERSVRFTGIPRGPVEVKASLVDANGASLGGSICSAEVIPNQAVASACALEE